MKQILHLAYFFTYDYILIEASGICEPVPIAQTIEFFAEGLRNEGYDFGVRLDNVISVVDAARLVEEFGGGQNLLKKNIEDDDIENLLIQQIEFCTKLVVNKTDLVTPEQLKEVVAVVKALQPEAEIIRTVQGKIDLGKALDTKSFDFEKASMSAAWIKGLENPEEDEEEEGEALEYNISNFVYKRRRPFDAKKFVNWGNTNYPKSVIRCKGVVWITRDEKYVYVRAGGQAKNSWLIGAWVVSLPLREQKENLLYNPTLREWTKIGDKLSNCVYRKGMEKTIRQT